MNRERLVVVLLCMVVALGVAVFALSLMSERGRDVAVAKLRARAATLERPPCAVPQGMEGAGVKNDTAKPPAAPPKPDTVSLPDEEAASNRLLERLKVLEGDDAWKDVLALLGERFDEWTEADHARFAAFLDANTDLIVEIRRLANSGGLFYRLDYSKGFAIELPHLAAMRELMRLLMADALTGAAAGRYAEAVDDLVAGMNLAQSLEKEPLIISQLVRVALGQMVVSGIEMGIKGEDLPPDQYARLMETLAHATNRAAFADSFTGEGVMGLDAFDRMRSGDLDHVGIGGGSAMRELLMRAYGTPFARPWLNADEEAYADIMGRVADAGRLPYYEAQAVLEQINTDIANLPRTRFLSRALLPSLNRAVFSASRTETQMNLVCIGLAVEQYHARSGAYPPSLNAVAETMGGAIPMDPLTGQSYVYETGGNGYSLYSAYVGPEPGMAPDAPSRVWGADANGHISWRGPR